MSPSARTRVVDETWRKENGSQLASKFGAKAVGLSRLPAEWVPPSLALSDEICMAVRAGGKLHAVRKIVDELMPEVDAWRASNGVGAALILRSNATNETALDRGKFETRELLAFDAASCAEAALQICEHYLATGGAGQMAFLLQPLKNRRLHGHVANIRRVTKTRNQWEYEIVGSDGTIAAAIEGRFNSQRVELLDAVQPLPIVTTEEHLRAALQIAAAWIAKHVLPVVSVEWLVDDGTLWLVQCDDEAVAPNAIDPRTFGLPPPSPLNSEVPAPFKLFVVGEETKIHKLSLLKDFSPPGFQTSHAIHYVDGAALAAATSDGGAALAQSLQNFAGSGLVVRTACMDADRAKSMNLPRTDTVDGATAVEWMIRQLREFQNAGVASDKCAFLMHRFIPARKAAWTYFSPGDRRVYMDALWGLPDGIQYYPHDTYEFDVVTGRSDRPTVDYKPYVLWPLSSGNWDRLPVHPVHARRQCLSTTEIEQIARHAEAITNALKRPTQIMWFCGFDEGGEHKAPLPWYMEAVAKRPEAQAAAPLLPKLVIETKADLEQVLANKDTPTSRLILEPGPSLIREPSFINLVVRCAKEGNHVVVLQGSALAHAFYQITDAGVTAYSLRGTGRRRTLRKREFGKLVRDKIPEVIAATGETATYGLIPSIARKRILIAKAVEELWELSNATDAAQVEEVADLYEVINALLSELGLDWAAVQDAASKKQEKRGGFTRGIVLVETGIPRELPSDLLPPADQRRVEVSWQSAMRAAADIEVDGWRASIPFFALLDPDAVGAEATIGKRDEKFELRVELAGDRLTIEIEPSAETGPEGDIERDT